MSKHNDRKHSGRKGVKGTFLALLLIGALAIAVPIIMQDMELNRDAAEYEELRKSLATATPMPTLDEHKPVDPAVNIDISDETETLDSETEESGDEPVPSAATAEPQATENPAAEESAAPSQVLEREPCPIWRRSRHRMTISPPGFRFRARMSIIPWWFRMIPNTT